MTVFLSFVQQLNFIENFVHFLCGLGSKGDAREEMFKICLWWGSIFLFANNFFFFKNLLDREEEGAGSIAVLLLT